MKKINLYWWSEIFIQRKNKENYGDLLGKYLVEKISNKTVVWFNPKKKFQFFSKQTVYATIGSILAHVKKDWIVWGSGIISLKDDVENATFLAVRGPKTRAYLQNLGYDVPEVYGDPGLLLPDFYTNDKIEQKFEIGIIPHYNDYKFIEEMYRDNDAIRVIDLMTNDIEHTTDEILSCKKVLSSSLHGIIMSHAYQIPAVWIQFSGKVFGDGVKYEDYFLSVGLEPYVPSIYKEELSLEQCNDYINSLVSLPKKENLDSLKVKLMKACPFK
ncbi:polysaccharide pyruvyl transferase family protein [Neptunitalea lumnitzerae]|uniref:GumL protein n=1 Tax=Neptunitalea lumnitzerae TaxID=2965509 RepID=A0ABQ5MN53_9FLAO|nr:polysaccharide pyruvyl transferase family protein [Neptunitalea sp. Y10]GLB50835.1 GumL protein [Neptunitalea sp. Y10]